MTTKELEYYKTKIEREFDEKKTRLSSKQWTDKKDVLQLFYDNRNSKIWWFSWEINGKVNSEKVLLSHRACARASDLAYENPDLVEMRKISRFAVFRLKIENLKLINEFLYAK